MTIHAMIDIETLGTEPECVVMSVGAVKFDPYSNNEPYDKKHWKLYGKFAPVWCITAPIFTMVC